MQAYPAPRPAPAAPKVSVPKAPTTVKVPVKVNGKTVYKTTHTNTHHTSTVPVFIPWSSDHDNDASVGGVFMSLLLILVVLFVGFVGYNIWRS